jgi:hypothetical protein
MLVFQEDKNEKNGILQVEVKMDVERKGPSLIGN